jgi:hypothetical protein
MIGWRRTREGRRRGTPLGITNAYRVHEPTSGLGLLATLVFTTESNCWSATISKFSSEESKDDLERRRRDVGTHC